jgi:hypothetical protein
VDSLETLASSDQLPKTTFSTDHAWFRVYDARDGYGQANPGFGDTRFAPFDAYDSGVRVPTFYLAESLEAALLESSLHDVSVTKPRVVAESTLLGKLHARVVPPRDFTVVDLRDAPMKSLGLGRENVSSSSPEHYPCTRRLARAIHQGPTEPRPTGSARAEGIVWHSRQAEITGMPPTEIVVLFADRLPDDRGAWTLALRRNASGSLLEGSGQLLLDELAESLDVTISDDGELSG